MVTKVKRAVGNTTKSEPTETKASEDFDIAERMVSRLLDVLRDNPFADRVSNMPAVRSVLDVPLSPSASPRKRGSTHLIKRHDGPRIKYGVTREGVSGVTGEDVSGMTGESVSGVTREGVPGMTGEGVSGVTGESVSGVTSEGVSEDTARIRTLWSEYTPADYVTHHKREYGNGSPRLIEAWAITAFLEGNIADGLFLTTALSIGKLT